MNIAFFLTQKRDVVHLKNNVTIRQALEKMEYHRYSAVPLIDNEGKYTGTLTEGDLLWHMKHNAELSFKDAYKVNIRDVNNHMTNNAVKIDSDMNNLIELAKNQNFVPVVDDNEIFIGIIKRSDIISYCHDHVYKQEKDLALTS